MSEADETIRSRELTRLKRVLLEDWMLLQHWTLPLLHERLTSSNWLVASGSGVAMTPRARVTMEKMAVKARIVS